MAVILVLGDTHIPRRAKQIPVEFMRIFSRRKHDFVVCTGDLTAESVLNTLKDFGHEIVAVRGNMDYLPLPEYAEITIGSFRIGVIHGDQVYPRGDREQLEEIASEKGVDVLISGHTHAADVYKGDVILLNPGSATGVWGGGGGSMKPSFMIVEIADDEISAELYQLERGEVKRTIFRF